MKIYLLIIYLWGGEYQAHVSPTPFYSMEECADFGKRLSKEMAQVLDAARYVCFEGAGE